MSRKDGGQMKKPISKVWYGVAYVLIILVIIPAILIQACNIFNKTTEKEEKYNTYYVNVYIHEDKKILEMDLEQYIKEVVVGEMPASFHLEALKAQAIAARTYTLRRMLAYKDKGHPKHPGAPVCTDFNCCKAWLSEEWLKKNRGSTWMKENWTRISNAVEDTRGIVITHDGIPIDALFHSTSSGKTENSEDYFPSSVPYLRSVDSPYDVDSPKYNGTYTTSKDNFIKVLKTKFSNLSVTGANLANQVKIVERSDSGTIKSIKIGNIIATGRDIRSLFNLNSANFEIKFQGDRVILETTGYGHGVGMSQYGAEGYAKEGKTYQEIIHIYYKGVEIEDMERFME